MLHLVIDTSIYREKPRLDSPEFKAITYLSKYKKIQLHIPYMVENEFISHLSLEHEKHVGFLLSSLNKLLNYNNPGNQTLILKDYIKGLEANKADIVEERKNSFLKWLNSINAKQYKLSNELTGKSLEAYFYGYLPLKEPKVRKDIPDSFVFQQIIGIHQEHQDSLYLIIKDNGLRDACKSSKIQNCHKSLREFLDLDILKDILEDTLVTKHISLIESALNIFLKRNFDIIKQKINEEISIKENFKTQLLKYEEAEYIYICNVISIEKMDDASNIMSFGNGQFSRDFTANITASYLPISNDNPQSFSPFNYSDGSGILSYMKHCIRSKFELPCRLNLQYDFTKKDLNNESDLKNEIQQSPNSVSVDVYELQEIKDV